MLAEAFISKLMYREEMFKLKKNEEKFNGPDKMGHQTSHFENSYGSVMLRESQKVLRESRDELNNVEIKHFVTNTELLSPRFHGDSQGDTSEAVNIPRSDAKQLDLYTSWSSMYESFYKNYPDLHIGGDHFLNKTDSGCILDLDNECPEGPVLLSEDIATDRAPSLEILAKQSIVCTAYTEENSILPPNAPMSSSVLNHYIESKVQELYKQFLEENIISDGSPNCPLFSSILMCNVNKISKYVSQEHNLDHTKTRKAILDCIQSSYTKTTSEFSTPVLHVSSTDSKKKIKYVVK